MSGNLRDDCFLADRDMLTLDEALARLDERLVPVCGTEPVHLSAALGRILAEDVPAPRDVPPHDNSAVDGYGVAFADLAADGPTRLPVGARVAAGHPLDRPSQPGEAVRIFTGAPLPDGVDTVFMQEDCALEGEDVILPPGIRQGANRRRRAEDVREGDVILAAGSLLRPQELGLAASVGRDRLNVFRRLRVAVFSTGDEVRDPGAEAEPGAIFDANRYAILGLLADMGCAVTDLGILPDRFDVIRAALASAAGGHDLLITSGGVSLGEEDHVKAAVEAQGALHFWKLAIKPGRPIALGQVKGCAFVGLPGNPVAAMVTFLRVARPVVLRLAGRAAAMPPLFQVPAGFAARKKPGRREWLRARLERDAAGRLVARQYPAQGSGILTSMVWADGLVELPEDNAGVAEGDLVGFLPFGEVTR